VVGEKQTCVGLQTLLGLRVHGFSLGANSVLCGQQQSSVQSSAQPQSHSSPSSTTPLPHSAVWGSGEWKKMRLLKFFLIETIFFHLFS
jgi:hypothetical protein